MPGLLCEGIPRLLICAEPDFAFGHRITQTIDTVLKSIAERRWVRVDEV
ncbi:MAG TPA: hypothetical protein VE597_08490 [Geminicoccaceae bacterium]|nr:hypothetical protein [Geminicoccaceae bacterium]